MCSKRSPQQSHSERTPLKGRLASTALSSRSSPQGCSWWSPGGRACAGLLHVGDRQQGHHAVTAGLRRRGVAAGGAVDVKVGGPQQLSAVPRPPPRRLTLACLRKAPQKEASPPAAALAPRRGLLLHAPAHELTPQDASRSMQAGQSSLEGLNRADVSGMATHLAAGCGSRVT